MQLDLAGLGFKSLHVGLDGGLHLNMSGSRRISTGQAADGLFVREGLFRVLPEASLMPVEELLRARVITFLVGRGLLPPDRARMLRGCLPGTGQTESCPGRLEAFGPRSCLPDGIPATSPP